jgi:hypothetical protein
MRAKTTSRTDDDYRKRGYNAALKKPTIAEIALPSFLKNTLLVVVVMFLCLLTMEPMTRFFVDSGKTYELEMWKYATRIKERDFRPDIGHRHRANARADLMGEDVKTDSHGFRSPEIPLQAPPGVARIAFAGDSITMGWGVAEKDTIPMQVLGGLKAQGRKVDGFNLGVGNYNTSQELASYKDIGAQMKPDIIVLVYFINDGEPMPTYNDNDWFEQHSAAYVVMKYRFDALMRSSGEVPDWKQYYRDLYKDEARGWKLTQESIAEFAKIAKDAGIQLVIVHVPELHELKPYPFTEVTAKVKAVVEAQGVQFIDLLPTVENLEPSTLWVTVPDPHPNGVADIAMSKGIVPSLLPMLDKLCATQSKGC